MPLNNKTFLGTPVRRISDDKKIVLDDYVFDINELAAWLNNSKKNAMINPHLIMLENKKFSTEAQAAMNEHSGLQAAIKKAQIIRPRPGETTYAGKPIWVYEGPEFNRKQERYPHLQSQNNFGLQHTGADVGADVGANEDSDSDPDSGLYC